MALSSCNTSWGSGFFCQEPVAWAGSFLRSPESSESQLHIYRSPAMFSHLVMCPYFLVSKQEVNFITCLFTQRLHLPGEPFCRLVLELLNLEARIYSVLSRVLVLAKENSVAAGSLRVWNSHGPLWNRGSGAAEDFGPCCCFHRVGAESLLPPPRQIVFFFFKPPFPSNFYSP